MTYRVLVLLASLAVALPAWGQSKLLVVLKSGEVRTFELVDVDRIEFTGAVAGGAGEIGRPVYRDPVGTWDWVDGQTLVVSPAGRFDLYRSDRTLISQGRWEVLESATRRYRFVHARGGYIDTVTLSVDGWELSGSANTGYRLEGRRRVDPLGLPTGGASSLEAVVAGTWDFADGRSVVVKEGGVLDVYTSSKRTDDGRWEILDATSRRVRFGYRLASSTDTLVLSADGRTLEGTNTRGSRVSGRRR